jgi:hypothetical protein
MTIRWWPRALLLLMNLPPAVAARIDAAVQRWVSSGEGIVHAGEAGVFLLYVDSFVVEFFVDVDAQTMHVDRVRRA